MRRNWIIKNRLSVLLLAVTIFSPFVFFISSTNTAAAQNGGISSNNYKLIHYTVDSNADTETDYLVLLSPTITLLWGPYLTGTTANSIVINVKTSELTDDNIEYATEAYYSANNTYEWTATDGISDTIHHIPLTGLESNTIYHYRLNYSGIVTDDYHFRTFPASGTFTFIVYSDTQDQLPQFSQYERYKLVADAVAAEPDIAFVLHCGDLVNNGDNVTDWDRYFDVSRQLLASTTVYSALGNHDNKTNSGLYYSIFGLSPDYSFDCGDSHFTILDSLNTSDAQTTWLNSDLDSVKPWKFVAFHYPMYTSDPNHFGGWTNLQTEWGEIFRTHGVEAVWNGHIHVYEHYLENGIHYIVMGTGGGPLGLLSPEKYEGYQNSLEHSLAYTKVTISPIDNSAIVQIIRVADVSLNGTQVVTVYPPGTVYDTFTITLPGTQPQWDLNDDHICDIGDIVKIGIKWGLTGTPGWILEDANNDGSIDIGDVVFIGLFWDDSW